MRDKWQGLALSEVIGFAGKRKWWSWVYWNTKDLEIWQNERDVFGVNTQMSPSGQYHHSVGIHVIKDQDGSAWTSRYRNGCKICMSAFAAATLNLNTPPEFKHTIKCCHGNSRISIRDYEWAFTKVSWRGRQIQVSVFANLDYGLLLTPSRWSWMCNSFWRLWTCTAAHLTWNWTVFYSCFSF